MGNLTVQTEEREGPLHSHYVSRANDGIYPAMSSPLGYEDQHPEDYRPATAREVAKYQGGQESITVRALPAAGTAPTDELVPTTLKMLDDEDPEAGPPVIVTPTTAQTAPAPLAADVGQPAPAPVVEPLPITPAPVAAIPVAAPAPAPLTPAPAITPATDPQPE